MEYLLLHSTVLQHRHQNSAKCSVESLPKSSSLIIGSSSSLVSKISFFPHIRPTLGGFDLSVFDGTVSVKWYLSV